MCCGLKPAKTNSHRFITIDKILLEKNFDAGRVMSKKTLTRRERAKISQTSQNPYSASTSKKSKNSIYSGNGHTIKQRGPTTE